MDAQKAAELIAKTGMSLTILSEGPSDLSREHVRYDCLLDTPGCGSYRCQYQSNPKAHGTPDLVSVLAAVTGDASTAAQYHSIDEFAEGVFFGERVSQVIKAWNASNQAHAFLNKACRFESTQDLFEFEVALDKDSGAVRLHLSEIDADIAPRFESTKTSIAKETIRKKVWQLGIFNRDHIAYRMASDYATYYCADEAGFAQAFDSVSGRTGTWEQLPASERSDYIMQAACEHAVADCDLLKDKFAERMRESACDMAHANEQRIADRIEASAESQEAFDAALDDAEARATSETHPTGKEKARADHVER